MANYSGTFLTEYDKYLFNEGTSERVYEKLGAHLYEMDGIKGVRFAVWCPNAYRVSITGDFNRWDERAHPMRLHSGCVWELFIPGLQNGLTYRCDLPSTCERRS